MRTTIKLDDAVFRAYKQRAAARGTTFAEEVEEVLRADLQSRRSLEDEDAFEVLVFAGDDSPALIDINDHEALQELDEDRPGGLR